MRKDNERKRAEMQMRSKGIKGQRRRERGEEERKKEEEGEREKLLVEEETKERKSCRYKKG